MAITDHGFRIPYPDNGGHDPLLVDVIQKCLVRDPAERASVEQLLEHPYLKKSPQETPSAGGIDAVEGAGRAHAEHAVARDEEALEQLTVGGNLIRNY